MAHPPRVQLPSKHCLQVVACGTTNGRLQGQRLPPPLPMNQPHTEAHATLTSSSKCCEGNETKNEVHTALLWHYYAVSSGNSLPAFMNSWPLKMGPVCSATSVRTKFIPEAPNSMGVLPPLQHEWNRMLPLLLKKTACGYALIERQISEFWTSCVGLQTAYIQPKDSVKPKFTNNKTAWF
jgi:hypothetical protein